MLKVGITGGIGSGKSIVTRLFALLGVPVYNADDAAKELMNTNPVIKTKLLEQFGEETYENGTLNRKWLAAKVFNDAEKLQLLNRIVHPVVINEGIAWLNRQTTSMVVKEAALFFESGSYKDMDYIIGVYAPQPIRISRVIKRDNVSEQAVLDRIGKQMNEEEKMKRCDFIIYNDEQQLIIPQVLILHEQLLSMQ